MSSEYKKLVEKYAVAAHAAARGDKTAHGDKANIMGEIRQAEREAARDGKLLSRQILPDGSAKVSVTETHTKRTLQEEYVRRFDDSAEVVLGGEKTTLRKYNAKRLLKK